MQLIPSTTLGHLTFGPKGCCLECSKVQRKCKKQEERELREVLEIVYSNLSA